MIVPALMLAMEQAGLGSINKSTDEAIPTLYWEELPQISARAGVWIVSDGDAGSTDVAERMQITIYARSGSKLWTQIWLDNITEWVRGDAQDICVLKVNPYELAGRADEFKNYNRDFVYDVISIKHTGATQTQRLDENGRLIKSITITIRYNERKDD